MCSMHTGSGLMLCTAVQSESMATPEQLAGVQPPFDFLISEHAQQAAR